MSITRLRDGRHLEVNEAAVRHGGFTREEMLGRTKAELGLWVAPEQREAMLQQLRRAGQRPRLRGDVPDADRRRRQLLVNSQVITFGGEPAC